MRLVLIILAFIVLLALILVWLGVITIPQSGGGVQVNPVEVKMETRNVQVQVPVVGTANPQPANVAQPAPAQPAPAQR